MPAVPRLQGPQVQERGLNQGRVQTDYQDAAFGIGDKVTPALMGLGEEVVSVVRKAEDDANKAQVFEAAAKLTKAKNELLYNPDAGVLNQKGKNAFGLPEVTNNAFKENAAAIEETLTNPRAKEMFRKIALEDAGQVDRDVQKHVAGEAQSYKKQAFETFKQASIEDAVLNYQDPAKLNMALDRIVIATEARGESEGLPKDMIELEKKIELSKAQEAVITRMLDDGNDMAAEAYFNNLKGGLTADAQNKIQKLVEAGSLLGKSQRGADEIVAKSGSMTAAINQARNIEDPKLRDATITKVKEFYDLKKTAEREDIETYERGILDQIDKNPDFEIKPSMIAGWPEDKRTELLTYANKRKNGISSETDRRTYMDLKMLAMNPKTKQAFIDLKLTGIEYRDKLNNADYKKFVDLQSDLRYGKGDAEKVLDGWRSESDIVNTSLAKIKLDRKKDPDKYDTYAKYIEDKVVSTQESLGRKVNSKELQQIVDDSIMEFRVKDAGILAGAARQTPIIGESLYDLFTDKKRGYELTEDEVKTATPVVPKAERDLAIAELKKRNLRVTDEAIVTLYVKKLKANRGR